MQDLSLQLLTLNAVAGEGAELTLGVAAAKLSAFTCNPFGAQGVDFDSMACFGHIVARFEFNFLIFVIATRPYFLGHCLLAHLRKGN